MKTLLLAVVFLTTVLPGGMARAAGLGGSDYRLDVGDKLRVKVFEWRAATGDVHQWTALDGDYKIGADGTISLPLVGALKASGLTTGQLADAASNQLQSKLGLTIKPQASIEIDQYRPFYILGDVNKPGEYAYRPGLTVLEAISVAGGRYRIDDQAMVVNATGDLHVLRLQYNELLARRARLEAELNDAATMSIPPELQRQQGDPTVAQLIQREQARFSAHRDALAAEINTLTQLKSLLNSEVGSLQDKMKNVDTELTLRKQELNSTTTLVQRGLAIAPREYTMRETELETEGRRLDLDTAALRAKEDIGRADQSIIELQNKDHSQIQSELAEAEQKIPETAARITTAATLADRQAAAGSASASATTDDSPAVCIITRHNDGKATQIDGDETTEVAPGDTIKVLRSGGSTLVSGVNAVVAADPPEPRETVLVPPPPQPRSRDGLGKAK